MAGPTPSNLVSVAQATFTFYTRSGPLPGYYFNPQTPVLGYCGIAYIQINIWNTNAGPTFETAKASGLTNAWAQSAIFTVFPGGYCCEPPCIPAPPYGLISLRLNGPISPPPIGINLLSTNTCKARLFSFVSIAGRQFLRSNNDQELRENERQQATKKHVGSPWLHTFGISFWRASRGFGDNIKRNLLFKSKDLRGRLHRKTG